MIVDLVMELESLLDTVLGKPQQILDTFNSYDHHVQFVHELEAGNCLPYLDMVPVRGQDQKIATEWYS